MTGKYLAKIIPLIVVGFLGGYRDTEAINDKLDLKIRQAITLEAQQSPLFAQLKMFEENGFLYKAVALAVEIVKRDRPYASISSIEVARIGRVFTRELARERSLREAKRIAKEQEIVLEQEKRRRTLVLASGPCTVQ